MATLVSACPKAKCPALRAELEKLDRFDIDAAAADAAYAPFEPDPVKRTYAPDRERRPPAGYRNATDAELAEMNLSRSFIDNPVFAGETKPSNFRAAVFVGPNGERLIAFKGTDSIEDWATNGKQGLGMENNYYTRAQRIASLAEASKVGASVRYTGHSLGGGLASAAARTTGRATTTFNAAGLHPDTVKNGVCGLPIDAVYVRGEILTSVQSLGLHQAASDQSWPLDPPAGYGRTLLMAGSLFGIKGWAAAATARSIGLHFMGSVTRSLAERRVAVQNEIRQCC